MKNLFYLLLCLIAGTSCSQADPTKPWDKGAFETQKYRNLLAEMGYKQADIDAKLKSVFDGVFYGPDKVYFEVQHSSLKECTTLFHYKYSRYQYRFLPVQGACGVDQ